MITNILPDNIFDKLDEYWNKTVVYTCPKQEDVEYLDDLYPRSTYFNDFIEVDELPDFKEGYHKFTFDLCNDLLIEWDEEDDYFIHPELANEYTIRVLNKEYWNVKDCQCKNRGECEPCLLMNAKKNILDKLRSIYSDYCTTSEMYEYAKVININSESYLHSPGFKYVSKCIGNCGFYPAEFGMICNLNEIKTLYCNVCLSRMKGLKSKESLFNNYKDYLLNKLNEHKEEYNEIVDFLKNPLPQTYEFTDEILFQLSEVI